MFFHTFHVFGKDSRFIVYWTLFCFTFTVKPNIGFKREKLHVQGTLDTVDIKAIEIEANYTGPKLEDDKITLKFMNDLIEFFRVSSLESKQWSVLHQKYTFLILRQIRDYFKKQPSLIEVELPSDENITVCGDIHGNLEDLLHIFDINGAPSQENRYLFNGNFVNRQPHSVECALIYFGYKLLYPDAFFINRGNHEDVKESLEQYGLDEEVQTKYPGNKKLLHGFWEVFQWLPLAHLIIAEIADTTNKESKNSSCQEADFIRKYIKKGHKLYARFLDKFFTPFSKPGVCTPSHGRVLVVHGGLFSKKNVTLDEIKQIKRGCDARDAGYTSLMFDMLWSDPGPIDGVHQNKLRYTSIQFGPNVTESFCNLNKIDYIIRSHVALPDGYHVEHNGRIVTVFSTANHHSRNQGAIVVLEAPSLKPRFTTYARGAYSKQCNTTGRVIISTRWSDEKNIRVGRYRTNGADPTRRIKYG
nr:PREDICTED: serine/threonine-protein phosphatase 5-like [Bemisia tabaci]